MRRHHNASHPQNPASSLLADLGSLRTQGPRSGTLARPAPLDETISFERLADSSQDVFWLADRGGHSLVYLSSRFEQLWGVEVAAAMNDPSLWNRAVVEADAALLPTPFFSDAGAGPADAVREYRIHGRDGRVVWIRDRRFQVTDAQGRTVRLGGIAENITERKEREMAYASLLQRERDARAQAEELARSKDEFLAVVTHELRSPLNAIRGWAHVLRQSGPLNPLQVKALDAVDRNTRTQALMVNDLLDSQSILCGELQLVKRRLPLASLLAEAVEAVQPAADTKRIRLEVLHDPAIGDVHVDGDRLCRALVAVLSNAVKFTLEDGIVLVRSHAATDHLQIAVHDTGIGLDLARLPALFDRFTQADRAWTRRQGGLGLGLSLAFQLIALHGGDITAHSDGLGKGATFTVRLPWSAGPDPDGEPRQRSLNLVDRPLAGRSVVLVEDEDDAREALEIILRGAGAEVQSFNRAQRAYEHLTRLLPHQRPSALLSDIAMPDEDGYAFIRRVRAFEKAQGLPPLLALAVTAFTRSDDRQRATDAGFNAHIAKPLDARIVVPTLCDAMAMASSH